MARVKGKKAAVPSVSSERSLFRVVSQDEAEQIKETNDFQYGGGALGKYFWSTLAEARAWQLRGATDHIVIATYPAHAIEQFVHFDKLDGIGSAYFADEDQMNASLIRITVLDIEQSND